MTNLYVQSYLEYPDSETPSGYRCLGMFHGFDHNSVFVDLESVQREVYENDVAKAAFSDRVRAGFDADSDRIASSLLWCPPGDCEQVYATYRETRPASKEFEALLAALRRLGAGARLVFWWLL